MSGLLPFERCYTAPRCVGSQPASLSCSSSAARRSSLHFLDMLVAFSYQSQEIPRFVLANHALSVKNWLKPDSAWERSFPIPSDGEEEQLANTKNLPPLQEFKRRRPPPC